MSHGVQVTKYGLMVQPRITFVILIIVCSFGKQAGANELLSRVDSKLAIHVPDRHNVTYSPCTLQHIVQHQRQHSCLTCWEGMQLVHPYFPELLMRYEHRQVLSHS